VIVDLPIGADRLTTECAQARARIREAFDRARATAAAWDLPAPPTR
jgi:hypothetical protein